MSRKRFKINRVASSDNYKLSRKLHTNFIQDWHYENAEIVTKISASIVVKKQMYVSVFGELIPISEAELSIHNTLIIHE